MKILRRTPQNDTSFAQDTVTLTAARSRTRYVGSWRHTKRRALSRFHARSFRALVVRLNRAPLDLRVRELRTARLRSRRSEVTAPPPVHNAEASPHRTTRSPTGPLRPISPPSGNPRERAIDPR